MSGRGMHDEAERELLAFADKWFPDHAGRAEAARRVVTEIRRMIPEPKRCSTPGAINANVDLEPVRCTCTVQLMGSDDDPDRWIYKVELKSAQAFFKSAGEHVQVGADARRLGRVEGLMYDVATKSYPNGVKLVVGALIRILDEKLKDSAPPRERAAVEF